MNKKVTLTQEQFDALIADQETLRALEQGGVDNWEWYDESLSKLRAERELKETIEDLATDMMVELSAFIDDPAGIREYSVMGEPGAYKAVHDFLEAVEKAKQEAL